MDGGAALLLFQQRVQQVLRLDFIGAVLLSVTLRAIQSAGHGGGLDRRAWSYCNTLERERPAPRNPRGRIKRAIVQSWGVANAFAPFLSRLPSWAF